MRAVFRGGRDARAYKVRVMWADEDSSKWEGYEPKIELVYDIKVGASLALPLSCCLCLLGLCVVVASVALPLGWWLCLFGLCV